MNGITNPITAAVLQLCLFTQEQILAPAGLRDWLTSAGKLRQSKSRCVFVGDGTFKMGDAGVH